MTIEDLIEGLKIMKKYDSNTSISADFYQINFGLDKKVSEEDAQKLDELGFFLDLEYEDENIWSFFHN